MRRSEVHDKTDLSLDRLIEFPLKIPINFKTIKLCDIKIDIEENKKELNTIEKNILFVTALSELAGSQVNLKKEIELALRTHEKYKLRKSSLYVGLLCQFYLHPEYPEPILTFFDYIMNTDEDIFEIIKSEGPISLRSSNTQRRLNEWISDKNISGVKLNKLRDSLMEYALGSSYKNKLLKPGRPEIEETRKFGKKWIKDLYNDTTSILKIAKKKNHKYYQDEEIRELIAQAFKDFILSMRDKYKKNQDGVKIKENLTRLDKALKIYEHYRIPHPIAEYIVADDDLKTEFNAFRWEPNKFAKEIIAKILNVSMSKIISILYR